MNCYLRIRHSSAGRNPAGLLKEPFELGLAAQDFHIFCWISAYAGMTARSVR
jgi:hypothetical protein